jgi:hypothetical protein
MIPLLLIPRKAKPVHVDAGSGMAVRKVAGRNLLSLRRRRVERFEGSWWVTVDSAGPSLKITVDRGYVNEMEPTIGGEPIGGIMPDGEPAAGGQPFLSHSGGMAWVCLKITPGANGKINPKSGEANRKGMLTEDVTVEIVGPMSGRAKGNGWYYPLASLSQYGKIAQMAYFGINYKAYKNSGDDAWRHRISLAKSDFKTFSDILDDDSKLFKYAFPAGSFYTTGNGVDIRTWEKK